ncbi:hypothetical protein BJ875DRAFT_455005 [Amylocarpus encephaloides]|uniref:Major facilitator superfamily (MFS) profile domain-containing protein n=1 Tax=Amylocarpus encephaloides TaxID=45428 RepID=A0A9P7YN75_9HELO|nr:hypothetical protein BJ875DRAFT_455005 [Amylocarpus encephaloides]
MTVMMYFSYNVVFSFPVFLSTILTQMSFSRINSQGLSTSPYFISFLTAIVTTFIADRYSQRSIVIMVLSTIGAIGYI